MYCSWHLRFPWKFTANSLFCLLVKQFYHHSQHLAKLQARKLKPWFHVKIKLFLKNFRVARNHVWNEIKLSCRIVSFGQGSSLLWTYTLRHFCSRPIALTKEGRSLVKDVCEYVRDWMVKEGWVGTSSLSGIYSAPLLGVAYWLA